MRLSISASHRCLLLIVGPMSRLRRSRRRSRRRVVVERMRHSTCDGPPADLLATRRPNSWPSTERGAPRLSRSPRPSSSGSRTSTERSAPSAWSTVSGPSPRRALLTSLASGTPIGLLDGVPVAVKDLFLTSGWPTLRGSWLVDEAGPWEADAPAVAALRRHGAVLPGKTTTPELGWKGVTDAPSGVTRNPWNLTRTAAARAAGARPRLRPGWSRSPWDRWRRLDPDPMRLLRPARAQADVRAGARVAGQPVRSVAHAGRWPGR